MIDIYLLDKEFTPIHLYRNQEVRLNAVKSTWKINEIPMLSLTFPEGNTTSELIQTRKTKLKMIDSDTNELIFKGRFVNYNYGGDSQFQVEGTACYLRDSIQEAEEFTGKPSALMKKLLDVHNSQASEDTQIIMGDCEIDMYRYYPTEEEINNGTISDGTIEMNDRVTVKANARYIWGYLGGPRLNMASGLKGRKVYVINIQTHNNVKYYLLNDNTWGGLQGWVTADELVEGLVVLPPEKPNVATGYVEKERIITCEISDSETTWDVFYRELFPYGQFEMDEFEGKDRLHIKTTIGKNINVPVEFGVNILEFSEAFDPTDIYTHIKPIGKPVPVEGAEQPEDITLPEDFVISEELLEMFDPKSAKIEFKDVETQNDLRQKAIEYIGNQLWDKLECNITALELHKLGVNYEEINIGDRAEVRTQKRFMSNGILQITKKEVDHLEGWKSSLLFGSEEAKLTDFFLGGKVTW